MDGWCHTTGSARKYCRKCLWTHERLGISWLMMYKDCPGHGAVNEPELRAWLESYSIWRLISRIDQELGVTTT